MKIKEPQKRAQEKIDEKENPSKKTANQTFQSIGVQCSKLDEDLLMGVEDSQTSNYFWKITALKRREALNDVNKENRGLDADIGRLNGENESIREEIKELLELLDEANSIKVSFHFIKPFS